MSLPIPSVGQEPGPQYATDVNNSLTIIDGHNHNPGSGVQITTSGLNINADLTFNDNNLTFVKSLRFQSQGSPLGGAMDLGCLYESGVDLYYNDGNGNQIRITSGGAIVGTAGSISGLVAPASASYNTGSGTFIWQSAANTSANMDFASAIFRNMTAGSNGVTVSAPAALGSNYTLVLPTIPGATNFVSLDTSGNFAAVWNVDNTTINFTGNNIQVKPGSITTTQISPTANIVGTQLSASANILGSQLSASANITGTQLAAAANILRSQIQSPGQQISPSSGAFATSSGAGTNVPNLDINITTSGNPIIVGTMSNPGSFDGYMAANGGVNGGSFRLLRDNATYVGACVVAGTAAGDTIYNPANGIMQIDVLGAGTYNYKIQAVANGGGATVILNDIVLYAYEMV